MKFCSQCGKELKLSQKGSTSWEDWFSCGDHHYHVTYGDPIGGGSNSWVPVPEIPNVLLRAADVAENLASMLRELHQLELDGDRQQLNCGLHMISLYEELMKLVEGPMHPDYRRNIENFRKKYLGDLTKK